MERAESAELVGRVVTPDGAPCSGLRVTLGRGAALGDSYGAPEHEARTDLDGRFVLHAGSGAWTLTSRGELPWNPVQQRAVELAAGARVTVDLVLERAPAERTIAGVVVDPEGRPVPGARVDVGLYVPTFTRDADDDGRFFVHVPFGERRVPVDVRAPGFLWTSHDLTVGVSDARVVLDRGACVTARLRAPAGDAAPERVYVVDARGGGMWAPVHDGLLRASGLSPTADLEPGGHHLLLQAPGWVPLVLRPALRAGHNDLGDLALRRGEALSLRVVDGHGAPVMHREARVAVVHVIDGVSCTLRGDLDDRGEVTIRGLAPGGEADVRVEPEPPFGSCAAGSTRSRQVPVRGPLRETMTLYRGVTLRGRLEWSGVGPAPWEDGVELEVACDDEPGWRVTRVTRADPFEVEVPAGRWPRVRLTLRRYGGATSPTASLGPLDVPEPTDGAAGTFDVGAVTLA